ncbi:MAG: hypothetical protein FWC61_04790 [Proteobacteria bacterium]|nr:hypothetical protein [Pseudomonadota bacterium]
MTKIEFLSEMKSRGAIMLPCASDRALELAQSALQQMRAAMMPMDLLDMYRHDAGGILLGDANIFGAQEQDRPAAMYAVPGIVQVNRELGGIGGMRGRCIFGRNALFWFGCDAFGNAYMLDNLTLAPLRKYEDIFRAMTDCLAVGKI